MPSGAPRCCLDPENVHGNFRPASVTIEDGFGFEAVVPVKSPIKSSRWDAALAPSGFFLSPPRFVNQS